MNYEIDPVIWFSNRQVEFAPPHFVVAQTHLTQESYHWVRNNVRGRFSVIYDPLSITFLSTDSLGSIAFEDPRDATIYELKWS